MDIREVFEQMKAELKEKWLDYYEINRDWIKVACLHQGWKWKEVVNGEEVTLSCPDSRLMIGVISGLDKRVTDFIHVSTKLTSKCDYDSVIRGLGLVFDTETALEERQREKEQEEDTQEAKLLTASGEDYTDPLLEELRREAREINNTSE
jgi:hypothetical protein